MIRAWLAALLLAAPGAAVADGVACDTVSFDGARFTTCTVSLPDAALRLALRDETGVPFGTFERLRDHLEAQDKRLVFAMNAGMYHPDRSPVGHYIEDGVTERGLVLGESPGNFGLLPNGVLCIREGRADVIETTAYRAAPPDCRYATQSGPMLVIDRALHPRFIPGSTSRFVRNGVGTSADGKRAVFAISASPVSFHHFARFFRDALGLNTALYLDGNVSRLYAAPLGRADPGRPMGPIVMVTAPAAE